MGVEAGQRRCTHTSQAHIIINMMAMCFVGHPKQETDCQPNKKYRGVVVPEKWNLRHSVDHAPITLDHAPVHLDHREVLQSHSLRYLQGIMIRN